MISHLRGTILEKHPNQVIVDAFKRGASDIHIEPYAARTDTVIRIRIDGNCVEYQRIPASYRRALELWPQEDAVLNDLGNTLAMQGRQAEALDLFQRAVAANPSNAAAHFNASQIYTQRFEFRSATEALSRASALDFELVRTYQSQGTADGMLPLVDQWLKPHTLWLALWRSKEPGAAPRSLPPAWRTRIEASGPWFGFVTLAAALLSLALGLWQHRAIPVNSRAQLSEPDQGFDLSGREGHAAWIGTARRSW